MKFNVILSAVVMTVMTGCTVAPPNFNVTGNTVTANGTTLTSNGNSFSNSSFAQNRGQVMKPAKEVRVYNTNFIMQVGMDKKVQANVLYSDDSVDQNLVFSSTDETVLQVDSLTGKATAIKEGMATLVVQSSLDPNKKSYITVTVKPEPSVPTVAYLSPSTLMIMVGGSKRFEAKIQMSNGENSPNIIWKSDNEGIAIVSNGLVTGVAPGETTIYAQALGDPTKRASAKITVIARP